MRRDLRQSAVIIAVYFILSIGLLAGSMCFDVWLQAQEMELR